jgi:hypothetical protein
MVLNISSLNEKIRLYLNEIYGPFGYSYGKILMRILMLMEW